MGFSISPGSVCQFKSVSLRTNKNFVDLYNFATRRTHRSRVLDDVPDAREAIFRIPHSDFSIEECKKFHSDFGIEVLEIFHDKIRNVDKLMKRAENAELSKLLAGITLQYIIQYIGLPWFARSPLGREEWILDPEILLKDLLEVFAECVSSGLESAHKLVVSALAVLSFMYQYLIGCVDKGGSKTYSPGSFLFRLIFVAIVLFLGSYVWIKSRQVSYTANRRKRKLGDKSDLPVGVTRRALKGANGIYYKYVPFLKPHREDGLSQQLDCLPLGSHDTPSEARIVYHIAAVLYGREKGGPVQFEDGLCLPFPSVTEPEECPPSGKEKADWVTRKTKKLYAELLERKAGQLQLLHPALETGLHHHGHAGEASRRDPSPSAPGACSTAIESTCFTIPHEGYGVVEQATTSESHGLGQEPLLTRDLFSPFVLDWDVNQVVSNLPQSGENDFLAIDEFLVDYSETDHVSGSESTAVPPQSSALDKPTSAIVASPPQLGGGDQDLGVIVPHLNSATAITFQQLESLPEQAQLQQRVTCQEQRPEEFSESNVELERRLLECEGRNAELQQKLRKVEKEKSEVEQKLRKSEIENKKHRQWRSMFRQLAKLMLVSDEDGNPADIQ